MMKYIINADSIQNNLGSLLPSERMPEVEPLVNIASNVVMGKNVHTVELKLPENPAKPSWNKDYMTPSLAAECHKKLSEPNIILHLKCPVYVKGKWEGAVVERSHLDFYIAKDFSDRSQKPRFVREGITIPEDRAQKIRGYTSLIVIESGPLATLLGDSENPAHTEWEKNATKFKGKYQWGPSTIDFVRLGVSKALKLMSQGDEKEDFTVLSDIFYLEQSENEEDVPCQRLKKKKKNNGDQPEPSPQKPPKSRPRHYRLSKIDEGFVLKGPKQPLSSPRVYKVTLAYDFAGASKASALKKYHKNDFALDKGKYVNMPQVLNVKNFELGSNVIEFFAEKNDFEVKVVGFDPDRDVIVDVKSEVVKKDETF